MENNILSGVRVLEVDNGLAQYAGKILADMGADVIKIEPPEGVPARQIPPFYHDQPGLNQSLHFWHYNTSKRSVVIDIFGEEGREAFEKLAGTADVILDGMGFNVMASCGLGYNDLRKKFPRLNYCYVTAFGSDGPWAAYQSSDIVNQALGGTMSLCGYGNEGLRTPPIAPAGGQAANLVSVIAVSGIVSALIHTQKSNEGQLIDVAAHDAINASTEFAAPYWEFQRVNVIRQSSRHAFPTVRPPVIHRCKDGKYFVCLNLYMDDKRYEELIEWFDSAGMADELRDEKFNSEAKRKQNQAEFVEIIGRFCAMHDSDYLFLEAQKRRMPWGPVNYPHELVHDPHIVEDRQFFQQVVHEDLGEAVLYPGAPYKFSGTPWQIQRRPPRLGEHTQEVLQEIGVQL